MDNSFELRVKKLFGSHLFQTVPNTAFPSSSWSVAAGEVHRREWNRERPAGSERDDLPCGSAFDDEGGCFSKKSRFARNRKKEFEDDLDNLDDGKEDQEEEGDGEEREIRSSVGLDPTLDNEEEEDEFDRVAFFKEDTGERMYMRDIKDHGPHLNYHSIVSEPLEDEEIHHHLRDPRADHFAARARLNEDNDEAVGIHSLVSVETPSTNMQAKITEVDSNLKPILKRKEATVEPRPKKRVRFDPGCIDDHEDTLEETQDSQLVPQAMETHKESPAVSEEDLLLPQETPAVPDYIKNPSKYICYTLDSSDVNEETNRRAFEDFRNLVRRLKAKNSEPELPFELPKSVIFTPQRKKASDAISVDDGVKITEEIKEPDHMVQSMGIAAGEAHESDTCKMEEDEIVDRNLNQRKGGRKYRSKSSTSDSV